MTVDAAFSRKMTVLSVCAMVSVVFIHSTAYLTMSNPARWNVFVETLITRSWARWAVPFFFAVSGFWFGRGRFISGCESYSELFAKKSRSLILPYLCWCLIGFFIGLPLILSNNILTGRGLWERTIFALPDFWSIVDAFWGITTVGPRTLGPLWYLRALIILFAFAPIWRLMMRLPCGRWILLSAAILETVLFRQDVSVFSLAHVGIGYFAAGLAASKFSVERLKVNSTVWIASVILFGSLSIMLSLTIAGWFPAGRPWIGLCEDAFIPAVGIVFFWGAYDRISGVGTHEIPWCLTQTFVVYCLHEPICGYFLAFIKYVLGKSDAVTCISVFIVPLLAFATCLLGIIVARRLSLRLYGLLSGLR